MTIRKSSNQSHPPVWFVLLIISICVPTARIEAQQKGYDPSLLKGLAWRSIGPYRGGRSTAVAGVTSQQNVFYFGSTGGGVWKTNDGGINWEPVSDEYFKTGSVGAIGISESDPNVVYVGMGESPIRGNVSHGDGVYKSTDAGKTWKHIGLEDTRQIARVRVHPRVISRRELRKCSVRPFVRIAPKDGHGDTCRRRRWTECRSSPRRAGRDRS